MPNQKIAFIGKPLNKLLEVYKELGYEIAVVLDEKDPASKFPSWLTEIYRIDMSSKESALVALDDLRSKGIEIILSTNESYILPKSWITNALGLPGASEDAAAAATDKYLMRSKFAEYEQSTGVTISPQFAQVESREDLLKFVETHNFPLILKPANLFKSILVTKAHNLEELLAQYDYAVGKVAQIYQENNILQRQPKFVVEEFLVGKMHSVEGFVSGNGEVFFAPSVVDLTTAKDIGVDDNYHFSRIIPSALDETIAAKLFETARAGIKALGLCNSAAHVELINTDAGPRIIEIGARIGGYRIDMFKMGYGADLIAAEIAAVSNQSPEIVKDLKANIAVIELFPSAEGNFAQVSNVESLNALKSLNYFSIKRKSGDLIGLSSQGYKATAVVILQNESAEEFQTDYNFVLKNVKILLR